MHRVLDLLMCAPRSHGAGTSRHLARTAASRGIFSRNSRAAVTRGDEITQGLAERWAVLERFGKCPGSALGGVTWNFTGTRDMRRRNERWAAGNRSQRYGTAFLRA